METLNISLPEKLAIQVDNIIKQEGYASRSEFIRTLVRFYLSLPWSIKSKKEAFFISFKKQPLKAIEKELHQHYSQKFSQSIVAGLTRSSLYANKTSKI